MAEAVNEYVGGRLQYHAKLMKEAADSLDWLKAASKSGTPEVITPEVYYALVMPIQEFRKLAHALDEAMTALEFYASADTWREVPEHTYAAQDIGMKARVALARIDPV